KKVKILYVDDEEINLLLFEANFNQKYEVKIAENGLSGLEVLENNPDILIIISDMKMPNMNGIEFINKAKRKYPDKKFYILTGFEITEEMQKALETGLILKYFSKPFDMNEIESSINEAVNEGW
ncbi:MAG: response regulator, partial [Bacteroidales bacterium]|nr:response regulator [Bacteroidales bacterium]